MLNTQGQKLLELLVSLLEKADSDHPENMIGYKDVHDQLGLSQIAPRWDDSLKKQGLLNLANWTNLEGKPAITGIVVNQKTRSPGGGYFRLFDRNESDFPWWREQVEWAKKYDWSPYIATRSNENTVDPEPIDFNVPPDRKDVTTSRIIRDSQQSRRVKRFYNYECQVCGHTILLNNGQRYAEAHHVQPLGKPHDGPDVPENIICLCPNHHTEFDYGIRRLEKEKLCTVDQHEIGDEFVSYHNRNIYGQ